MTATRKFIAYYRVSTQKQGRSGLGLDAQREAVANYLNGGKWKLVEEIVEVESGKRNDRPALARALHLCQIHNATLIIAKLDRLARNVAFTANLMESKLDFVAVDYPDANRLTIHILAAVAEHEARLISARTKDALAAAKTRGTRLGSHSEWHRRHREMIAAQATKGNQASLLKRRAAFREWAAGIRPEIESIKADGASSLRQIAAMLNNRGIPTRRGGEWTAVQVARVL